MRQQAVAVHGHLKCGDAPAKSVRVKLFDEDSGPDPDDLLDQGYTDDNGEFKLQGSTMETTNIDPVFKVYHDCNDGMKPGSRKVRFIIPSSYITNGSVAKKTFELGTLNLETIFGAESRELMVSKKKRRHLLSEKFNLFSNF
uniref:Transthyretin-like family protein n=1 Tax=Ditylenchus dipsaci TaxID=166011 RepID=A0A915EHT0_9BILA